RFGIEELERHMEKFRGEFLQTPPAHSAKKLAGRRAYELARKSVAVELAPVPVHVYELTLVGWNGTDAQLRAHCSGGTYLRSIAHDLGQSLASGAHLLELRRTRSGEFDAAQARTIAELETLAAEDRLADALVPMGSMLPSIPSIFVDDMTAAQ